MNKYIFFLGMILFSACTFKSNEVKIKKFFNGVQYTLVANSTRDGMSLLGHTGSCGAIPLVLPMPGDHYFYTYAIGPSNDTLMLEYSENVMLIDSTELYEILNLITLDFSPISNQVWYFRDSIEYPKLKKNSIIIHQLDSSFRFYTFHKEAFKPNWSEIKSPRYHYELYLKDYTLDKEIRKPLFEHLYSLPYDDSAKYFGFSLWDYDKLSRDYIVSIVPTDSQDVNYEKWTSKTKKLLYRRTDKLLRADTLMDDDIDELKDLTLIATNNARTDLFSIVFQLYEKSILNDNNVLRMYNWYYLRDEEKQSHSNKYNRRIYNKLLSLKGSPSFVNNVVNFSRIDYIDEAPEFKKFIDSVFTHNWQHNDLILDQLLSFEHLIGDTSTFYNSIRRQLGTKNDSIARKLHLHYNLTYPDLQDSIKRN